MIDWARVNELRDEVGEEDFDEVVELFIDEVQQVIDRLKQGADSTQLEEDLHFLKGSALSLGFQAFSALCQTGESMAKNGQADEVDLGAIIQNYEDSKTAFESQLAEQLAA